VNDIQHAQTGVEPFHYLGHRMLDLKLSVRFWKERFCASSSYMSSVVPPIR
jgi:hypothetical protein